MEEDLIFHNSLRDLVPPDVLVKLDEYSRLKRETLILLNARGFFSPGTADLPDDLETDLLELCGLKRMWAKKELVKE